MVYPTRISGASVLDAAIKLVEKDGVTALGMRPVAERLGVRAASLYRHCESLEALRHLVSEYAVQQLIEQLRMGIQRATATSGSARLAALMWSYVLWAEENPGLYDLVPVGLEDGSTPSTPLFALIQNETERAIARPNGPHAALAIWAYLHGHVLLSRGSSAGRGLGADALERGMVALLRGL